MEQVVPWAALVELIAPYYPEGRIGRPPFSLQSMLLDASNENIHVLTLSANELIAILDFLGCQIAVEAIPDVIVKFNSDDLKREP